MIEADSIESLPAQLHHRASLTHSRLMSSASPNTSPSPSQANRISRSNSIRYVLKNLLKTIFKCKEHKVCSDLLIIMFNIFWPIE